MQPFFNVLHTIFTKNKTFTVILNFYLFLPKINHTMKHLFKLSLVALLALTAVVSSCSKYDEGSNFSLISAKGRMAGDWKLSSYTVNGSDYTSSMGTVNVTIDKDGTYKGTASYVVFGSTVTDNFDGTWEFNSDKTTVSMKETGSSTAEVYTIIELKNKEMKLQQVDGNTTYLTTYVAQ
jgi:hypothetical protein